MPPPPAQGRGAGRGRTLAVRRRRPGPRPLAGQAAPRALPGGTDGSSFVPCGALSACGRAFMEFRRTRPIGRRFPLEVLRLGQQDGRVSSLGRGVRSQVPGSPVPWMTGLPLAGLCWEDVRVWPLVRGCRAHGLVLLSPTGSHGPTRPPTPRGVGGNVVGGRVIAVVGCVRLDYADFRGVRGGA